jgi:DNA-binding GntR family transcriptional regulator
LLKGKVRVHSLVDAVTERLEAAIVNGTLKPGSKLKEQALAKSLGVSRGPLREAIRRLEGRKLLQRIPNIGVRVAVLSLREVEEILQVQEALQGMACGLAAHNMSSGEVEALGRLLDNYQCNPSKLNEYDSWDLDFHSRIIAGSGNARLGQMLREDIDLLLKVYQAKSTTTRERALEVLSDHQKIVAAISKRDSVTAEKLMRQHIQTARKEWLTLEPPHSSAAEKGVSPSAKRRSIAR